MYYFTSGLDLICISVAFKVTLLFSIFCEVVATSETLLRVAVLVMHPII